MSQGGRLTTGACIRVSVGRSSVVRVEINDHRSLVMDVKSLAKSTVMQN